jgi:hypothetical protein
VLLQRVDGAPGKRTTKEEFEHIMKLVLAAREERVAKNKSKYKNATVPLLTADNAKWYDIDFQRLGFKVKKIKIPARSPDIHKVVEHVVARLENHMTAWCRDHPDVTDPETLWGELERFFYALDGKSVAADLRGLCHTLAAIKKVGGDWAPNGLR